MNPAAGTRLGPYALLHLLGAGGMGEVYRARDTRLGREVAIKILPAAFTADQDRLARFEREARLLASLNHPNVATIHGVEETTSEAGERVRAIVLELVEGDTLADRVRTGAVRTEDALAMARQIAEALDAAHEKGIIHRDLKPANIKLTPDGRIKVLDFGLAKALAEEPDALELTASPTGSSVSVAISESGRRGSCFVGTTWPEAFVPGSLSVRMDSACCSSKSRRGPPIARGSASRCTGPQSWTA